MKKVSLIMMSLKFTNLTPHQPNVISALARLLLIRDGQLPRQNLVLGISMSETLSGGGATLIQIQLIKD